MATKFEKSAALFDLADQVAGVSIKVFQYRLAVQEKIPLPKVKKLRSLEDALDAKTAELRAAATQAVTDQVAGALAEVTAATVKAQKVITKITKIENAIQVATAVIGLGVAVLSGNAVGIVNAVGKLKNVTDLTKAANANPN